MGTGCAAVQERKKNEPRNGSLKLFELGIAFTAMPKRSV
jgi:hypothetical protein